MWRWNQDRKVYEKNRLDEVWKLKIKETILS